MTRTNGFQFRYCIRINAINNISNNINKNFHVEVKSKLISIFMTSLISAASLSNQGTKLACRLARKCGPITGVRSSHLLASYELEHFANRCNL
jgi:hypothetical protein